MGRSGNAAVSRDRKRLRRIGLNIELSHVFIGVWFHKRPPRPPGGYLSIQPSFAVCRVIAANHRSAARSNPLTEK